MIKDLLKHTLFVALLIGFILLLGCQEKQLEQSKRFAVNTAVVTNALIELDQQFDNTSLIVDGLMVNLTREDIIALTESVRQLKQLRSSIIQTIHTSGGMSRFLINAEQLNTLALKGGESYARARAIIEKYWAGLPIETQQKLMQFDRQVVSLHSALIELNNTPNGTDITQTVQDVISIGAATAKVLMMTGVL